MSDSDWLSPATLNIISDLENEWIQPSPYADNKTHVFMPWSREK